MASVNMFNLDLSWLQCYFTGTFWWTSNTCISIYIYIYIYYINDVIRYLISRSTISRGSWAHSSLGFETTGHRHRGKHGTWGRLGCEVTVVGCWAFQWDLFSEMVYSVPWPIIYFNDGWWPIILVYGPPSPNNTYTLFKVRRQKFCT